MRVTGMLLHQFPDFAVHKVLGTARVAADDGRATRHALNEDHAERFLERRKHADTRGGVKLCENGLRLGPNEVRVLATQILCHLVVLLLVLLRSCTNDNCRRFHSLSFKGFLVLGGRLQDGVQPLPVRKLPHKHNHLVVTSRDRRQILAGALCRLELRQKGGDGHTLNRVEHLLVDTIGRNNNAVNRKFWENVLESAHLLLRNGKARIHIRPHLLLFHPR
mmetsp:Transcript_31159/g.87362  ORF Transcript_31159/g.87362 Transcript_31159/m.87362 type:complete len:220 (-) Transcript_31159:676-1335(-)